MPDEVILSYEAARAVVAQQAALIVKPGVESVPLLAAQGRILAEDIVADRPYPPFDRATRDGYAVRSADVIDLSARLRLVGQIKAGTSFDRAIARGECAEIMTGAPVPEGADAVVMVEFTRREGETVTVERAASPGENIVPSGSEARAGTTAVVAGTRLRPAQIAAAATVGRAQVNVYRKPRIAIISTGDEVVAIDRTPGPVQIRNSNSFSLAAQIAAAGAEPWHLPIAPDEERRLRELIREGLAADLLLLSGGVSMGRYDLVEVVLRELEAEFFFTGAKIQPGRPIVFGRVRGKYFFGLPGNPISTMVGFDLFARPMISALSGGDAASPLVAQATLAADFKTKTGLTRFLPAELREGTVQVIPWQGSGDIFAASRANCYLIIPPDRERLAGGERVSVLLPGCD